MVFLSESYSLSDFKNIIKMFRRFADCRMYSVIDRLANATGKGAVYESLYEALRISISAQQRGAYLCEEMKKPPYVPPLEEVEKLLSIKDVNLLIELSKKIAIASISPYTSKREKEEESR